MPWRQRLFPPRCRCSLPVSAPSVCCAGARSVKRRKAAARPPPQMKMAGKSPAIFFARAWDCSALRDELRVQVGLQAFDAAFGAVARLLDAAKRRFRRRDSDAVDADHT